MAQPVIIEAVRTPIGKRNGWMAGFHAPELLGNVQVEVVKRAGIDPSVVEQVVGGCVTQAGEQAFNVTRMAWLSQGLPYATAATTVDCQCGSSQQANHFMNNLIGVGAIEVGIACGVEAMSRVGLGRQRPQRGSGRCHPDDLPWDMPDQFGAGERIARKYGITRADVDWLGIRVATKSRRWPWPRVASVGRSRPSRRRSSAEGPTATTGERTLISRDQGVRETTHEGLAALTPVLADGMHTAGNSSQISDGAAAVLWMSSDRGQPRGPAPSGDASSPRRWWAPTPTSSSTDPSRQHLTSCARQGWRWGTSTSSRSMKPLPRWSCAGERSTTPIWDKVNVNGGAIALGHPVGSTGARLIRPRSTSWNAATKQVALISMCCGGALATGTMRNSQDLWMRI